VLLRVLKCAPAWTCYFPRPMRGVFGWAPGFVRTLRSERVRLMTLPALGKRKLSIGLARKRARRQKATVEGTRCFKWRSHGSAHLRSQRCTVRGVLLRGTRRQQSPRESSRQHRSPTASPVAIPIAIRKNVGIFVVEGKGEEERKASEQRDPVAKLPRAIATVRRCAFVIPIII